MIRDEIPSAKVTGRAGRESSSEVKIDGKLVYSKLSTHSFPDFEDVVLAVQDVASGKAAPKINDE